MNSTKNISREVAKKAKPEKSLAPFAAVAGLTALLLLLCIAPAAHAQRISSLPRTNTLQGAASSNLVMVTALEGGTNGSFAYTFPDFAALMEPYYTGVSGASVSQLNTTSNALVNYANGTTNASIVRQTQLTAASNALYSAIGGATGSNFVVSTHGTAIVTGEVSAATAVISGTINSQGDTYLSGISGITANRVLYLDIAKKIQTSSGVTPTELEYLDNVTSAIQTQLDSKPSTTVLNTASNALVNILVSYDTTTSNGLYSLILGGGITANTATNIAQYFATNSAIITSNQLVSTLAPKASPTFTGAVTISSGTANELVAFDASKALVPVAGVSATEAGYLDGVTSLIQSQLDTKPSTTVLNTASNAIVGLFPVAGTNNPVTLSAGTLTLISSQTARYYTNSAGSFPFTFSGTPNASSRVSLAVSNTSASTIYVTNTSGIYDPTVASNVTAFAVSAQSQSIFGFRRNATSGWELESLIGKEYAFTPGSSITFTTNSDNSITIAGSAGGMAALEVQTNGVRAGLVTNINFGNGFTGAVSGSTVTIAEYRTGASIGEVSVLDFGADRTGAADSTLAFQAAATNSAIYIPPGTYVITNVIVTNATLRGLPGKSIVRFNTNAVPYGFMFDTRSNLTHWRGITFDGGCTTNLRAFATSDEARSGINLYIGGESTISDCQFINWHSNAVFAHGINDTSARPNHFRFENNGITNCWTGLWLPAPNLGEYSVVSGNKWTLCYYALRNDNANVTVVGNAFHDDLYALYSYDTTAGRSHSLYSGNTFNHTRLLWQNALTGASIIGNHLLGATVLDLYAPAFGLQFQGNYFESATVNDYTGGTNIFQGNRIAGAFSQGGTSQSVYRDNFGALTMIPVSEGSALAYVGTNLHVRPFRGSTFDIVMTQNSGFTIEPGGEGQRIRLRLTQDGTGSRTAVFTNTIRFSATYPAPTLSTGIGKTDWLDLQFWSASNRWDVINIGLGN